MTKLVTKRPLTLARVAIMVGALHAAPSHATFAKVWVAYNGTDSAGCGQPATPCATFQQAQANLAAGGEISVLTPGEYGGTGSPKLNIVKSLSITNDATGEAGILVGGGDGISITAGPGDVIGLRGLVIDGQAGGNSGIGIINASAVHIQNCVIRNFQDAAPGGNHGNSAFGIALVPAGKTQLFVTDTLIYNNGQNSLTSGILIEPQNANSSADVVLDRVHLENNVDGILIYGPVASGGSGSHVVVRDSVIAGNAGNGIRAFTQPGKSPAFAFVERSSFLKNGANGILADGPGATVLVRQSTITRNGAGVATVNGGQLISFGDNANANNIGPEGVATGFRSAF